MHAAPVSKGDNVDDRERLAVALAIVQARRRLDQCAEWKQKAELAQEELKASQAAIKLLSHEQGLSKLESSPYPEVSPGTRQLESIMHAVASECSKPFSIWTSKPGIQATLAQLHSITINKTSSADATLVRQKVQGMECLLRHIHIIHSLTQHNVTDEGNDTGKSFFANMLTDLTSFVTDVLVVLPPSALQQAYAAASLTVLSAALNQTDNNNRPHETVGTMLCKMVSMACTAQVKQEHVNAKCRLIADNTLRMLCAMLQYPSLGLLLLSVLSQQLLDATQQQTQHLMKLKQTFRKQYQTHQAHGDVKQNQAELLSTLCHTQVTCASKLQLIMQCVDKLPVWLHSIQAAASLPCSDEYGAVSQSQRQTQTNSLAVTTIKGTATDNLWQHVDTATERFVESYALSTSDHSMAAQRLKLQGILAKLAVSLQHVGLLPGNEGRVMQACQLLKHALSP